MDNIITPIVIIILVVWIVNKFKSKGKTGQVKKLAQGGGLIDKLNAFLQQVQDNLEQQNKKTTAEHYEWEELMEDDEQYKVRQHYPEPQSFGNLDRTEGRTPAPAPPPPRKRPVTPRIAPTERKTQGLPVTQQPVPGMQRSSKPKISIGRGKLRKAIIWSEILGPPVALRKQQRDRF